MTTLLNRLLPLFVLGLLTVLSGTAAGQRRDVPMSADHWETTFGKFEFKEHNGAPSLVFAEEGAAAVKGLTFRNGTVEFDVDPKAMGAGLGFRVQSLESLEMLYFRPQDNCAAEPDCVQYAPFTRKVLLWDMFPQYQGPAPLRPNQWNHVKVVVSGQRMNLFVNGAASPTLSVGSLEGDTKDGQLVLVGPGAFANFKVTPDAVEGLSGEREADPTARDERFVRHWQLSPFSELPDSRDPAIADLPKSSAEWRPLAAERGGVVNVTRVYGLPVKRPTRSLTWLKTTISSSKSQSKKALIGLGREVWVFVNGQPVFADKNLYQPPTARKAPDGRISLQNGSFVLPLKAGDNEVAIAVANNFYGWGVILRLENLEGLKLARK